MVSEILEQSEKSRNSDKKLILNVWWANFKESFVNKNGKMYVAIDDIVTILPSPESIRRTRQKLQQGGQFLPTKEVKKTREEIERNIRNSARTNNIYNNLPK